MNFKVLKILLNLIHSSLKFLRADSINETVKYFKEN